MLVPAGHLGSRAAPLPALKNHPSLGQIIEDHDVPALEALTDIRVVHTAEPLVRLLANSSGCGVGGGVFGRVFVRQPDVSCLARRRLSLAHARHPQGYKVVFEFGTNPFFTNKTLSKGYEMTVTSSGEVGYKKVTGCVVLWCNVLRQCRATAATDNCRSARSAPSVAVLTL